MRPPVKLPTVTQFLTDDDFVVEFSEKKNISITSGNAVSADRSVAKTGYTPICVAGLQIANSASGGGGSGSCVVYTYSISGNHLTCWVRNYGSSTAKVDVNVRILYIKNK